MSNQLPTRPSSREAIYEIIDGERAYQEKTYPDSPAPTGIQIADLIDEYALKTVAVFAPSPALTAPERVVLLQKRFREVAAIAVHGLEILGAVPRENHVPASAGVTGTLHATAKSDAIAPHRTEPVQHSEHEQHKA
jgi:hypothetical protein